MGEDKDVLLKSAIYLKMPFTCNALSIQVGVELKPKVNQCRFGRKTCELHVLDVQIFC